VPRPEIPIPNRSRTRVVSRHHLRAAYGVGAPPRRKIRRRISRRTKIVGAEHHGWRKKDGRRMSAKRRTRSHRGTTEAGFSFPFPFFSFPVHARTSRLPVLHTPRMAGARRQRPAARSASVPGTRLQSDIPAPDSTTGRCPAPEPSGHLRTSRLPTRPWRTSRSHPARHSCTAMTTKAPGRSAEADRPSAKAGARGRTDADAEAGARGHHRGRRSHHRGRRSPSPVTNNLESRCARD
jgi:hypothetical protein